MKFNKISAAVALGLSSVSQISIAVETTEPVIVTATRTAQTADESLASVTVITRDDIEKSQSPAIAELLKTQAGIDFGRNGGIGQSTSVFMRGTNSDHILVLIDGVRVSSTTTGIFAWGQMPVSQIERIEIVRGPRSALYGSDAIGGVIQIFTRKNKGVTARVEAGSYNKHGIQAGWGGGEQIKFNINAEFIDIGGFSSLNRGSSYIPDDDGYENRNISTSVSMPIGNIHSMDISFLHSDGISEYDGSNASINERNESINQVFSTKLKSQLQNNWLSQFSLGYSRDDSRAYSGSPSKVDTSRKSIDWQNDFLIDNKNTIIAGLSYSHDSGKKANPNTGIVTFNHSVSSRSVFLNWTHKINSISFDLGGRYENHSAYDNHTTLHAATGFDLSENLNLYASYGEGYKTPDINELFHPGSFYLGVWNYSGNSNLKPEETESFEIGMKYKLSASQLIELNAYKTDAKNLIDYQGTNNQAINVSKADMSGFEAIWKYNKNLWWAETAITIQDTDDSSGNDLLRRADRKIGIKLGKKYHNGANLFGEYFYTSSRRDYDAVTYNIKSLGGYGIVNIASQYPLSKQLVIEARIENLLDKHYEHLDGYNTADRSFYLALRYKQ